MGARGLATTLVITLAAAFCAWTGGTATAPAADRSLIPQGGLSNDPGAGLSPFRRPKTDNPFRAGTLARGKRNILAAWFSGPQARYRFSAFAGETHPDTLTISTANNQVLRLTLPPDSVFEDLLPRIVDLNGDGIDEIVVVRSFLKKGAALSVVSALNNQAALVSSTPPLGLPGQWLNPAGVADFDGDGRPEIALVARPHDDGELQFWSWAGNSFEQIATLDDVSNHVKGSDALGLSAIADFDGDGIAELAIPSQDRRTLRFIGLRAGNALELGAVRLVAPAESDFALVTVGGKPAVKVGLAGDRSVVIAPCRDVSEWVGERKGC